MKKIFALFSVLVMVVVLFAGCTSSAPEIAPNTFYDSGQRLQVVAPETLIGFMRDVKSDDPNLETVGRSAQDIKNELIEYEGFFIAFDSRDINIEYGIFIEYAATDTPDYNDWTNSELTDLGRYWVDEGYADTFYEVYKHAQTKFVVTGANDDSSYERYVDYVTVLDGMFITVYALNYDGEIGVRERNTLKELVDGITFNAPEPGTVGGTGSMNVTTIAVIALVVIVAIFLVVMMILRSSRKRAQATQPYGAYPGQPYGTQPYGAQQPYGTQGTQPYGAQQPYGGTSPYNTQQPYNGAPAYTPQQTTPGADAWQTGTVAPPAPPYTAPATATPATPPVYGTPQTSVTPPAYTPQTATEPVPPVVAPVTEVQNWVETPGSPVVTPAAAPAPVSTGTDQFCAYCGTKFDSANAFCPNCGQKA